MALLQMSFSASHLLECVDFVVSIVFSNSQVLDWLDKKCDHVANCNSWIGSAICHSCRSLVKLQSICLSDELRFK